MAGTAYFGAGVAGPCAIVALFERRGFSVRSQSASLRRPLPLQRFRLRAVGGDWTRRAWCPAPAPTKRGTDYCPFAIDGLRLGTD